MSENRLAQVCDAQIFLITLTIGTQVTLPACSHRMKLFTMIGHLIESLIHAYLFYALY